MMATAKWSQMIWAAGDKTNEGGHVDDAAGTNYIGNTIFNTVATVESERKSGGAGNAQATEQPTTKSASVRFIRLSETIPANQRGWQCERATENMNEIEVLRERTRI